MHEQIPNSPQEPIEQPPITHEDAQKWLKDFDESDLPNTRVQYDMGDGTEGFHLEDAVNRRNEDGSRTPIVVLKRADGSRHDVDVTEYLTWIGLKSNVAESREPLTIKTGLDQVEKLGELSLTNEVTAPDVTEDNSEANKLPTPTEIEKKTVDLVVQILSEGGVQLERAVAIREEFLNSAGRLRNIATDAQQPLRVLRNAINNPRDVDARQLMNSVRTVTELAEAYGRIKSQGEEVLSDSHNQVSSSSRTFGNGVEAAAEQSQSVKNKNPDSEEAQTSSKNLYKVADEVNELTTGIRQIMSQDKALIMLEDLPGARVLTNVAYEVEATLRRSISNNLPLQHADDDIRRLARGFGQIEEFSQMYLATDNRYKAQVREVLHKVKDMKEKYSKAN